jgi:hypothetical protein
MNITKVKPGGSQIKAEQFKSFERERHHQTLDISLEKSLQIINDQSVDSKMATLNQKPGFKLGPNHRVMKSYDFRNLDKVNIIMNKAKPLLKPSV